MLNTSKFESEGAFISMNLPHFTRKLTGNSLRKWRAWEPKSQLNGPMVRIFPALHHFNENIRGECLEIEYNWKNETSSWPRGVFTKTLPKKISMFPF